MAQPTDWDVEAYRSPHEPSHHWELRRAFMERHKPDIPRARLVCLAQTLANIEFMGCRYPAETLAEVTELSRGLVEELRERQKGKLQRTFVSGSEAASSRVNRTSLKRPVGEQEGEKEPVKKQMHKYGNFVASSSASEEVPQKLEGFVLPPKRQTEQRAAVEPSKAFMGFCNKVIRQEKKPARKPSVTPSTNFMGFCNNIISQARQEEIGDAEVQGGDDSTDMEFDVEAQKSAEEKLKERLRAKFNSSSAENGCDVKTSAGGNPSGEKEQEMDRNDMFAQAQKKFSGPQEPAVFKADYQRHFESERKKEEDRLTRTDGDEEAAGMLPALDPSFPHGQFLVVSLAYVPGEHPCSLLNRSASFCKMSVSWDYKTGQTAGPGQTWSSSNSSICVVKINGQAVCESGGSDKKDARDKAAAKAILILKKHCYTIEVKNQFLSDGTKVDLMDVEVNTSVGGKADALGQSNMGHKLLSLMGWTGGGLGKEGSGRAEPVTATTLFGREGLGNRGAGRHFKQKITKIVEEWMGSTSPYDLVFTTGFDNDQRKEMHQVARRFNLKSKSFGKGEDRHLTISKKAQAGLSLVEELLQRGGETEKYSLIPPGGS